MVNNITSSKFVDDQIATCTVQHRNLHWQLSQSPTQSSSSLTVTGDPGSTAQTCGGTVTGGSVCGTDSLRFWEQNSNMRTSKLAN